MLKFKQLDRYIIKNFIVLFFATFFICSFILIMQFLWMEIDNLVGKGLPMLTLLELFVYQFLYSMPLALPLAILLASLMTFGNMGEQLELIAMKTAGISLFRIMRPLIVFIGLICVGAFFFSNNAIPIVQKKMYTILISVKSKSPELDIPIGQFYSGIDNMRIYVRGKDHSTGALNNVMIYDLSKGFENTSVTTADTLYVDMTKDKRNLQLRLINGESFENLNEQSDNFKQENVPYRRETFKSKTVLLAFDANFNMYDESRLEGTHISKNFAQLKADVDSITTQMDSIKQSFANDIFNDGYSTYKLATDSKNRKLKNKIDSNKTYSFDTLLYTSKYKDAKKIAENATNRASSLRSDLNYKRAVLSNAQSFYAKHGIEMHRKFTLSFACLVFFFIGAPLGAIIRKGGLGMPTVISVVMFIIYFIIDTTSKNLAIEGILMVWQGMWLSSFVLLPIGVFLTYKAARDSTLFNVDAYKLFIKRVAIIIKWLINTIKDNLKTQ